MAEEIRMPDEPGRLIQHVPVDVLMTLRTAVGEERTVLAGRSTTQHLRPNGAIVIVKPQIPAGQMPPLKRGDLVRAKFRRPGGEHIEGSGVVSWVRVKAFLPSGLAVTLVGITFDWDADEHVLEVAAFLARESLPPPPR